MSNRDIADIFSEIADLLEIRGEQVFRVNSYRRAARVLEGLSDDAAVLLANGKLAEVQGIGKGTLGKIEEYLETGKVGLHQELLASMPAGLPALLRIPSLGCKKVAMLWKDLKVEDLAGLQRVIASGELAAHKGMGVKSVQQIADGIAMLEKSSQRTPLGIALPLAEELVGQLKGIRTVRRADIAGSLRRGCETIGDIDLLCESPSGKTVIEAFTQLPMVKRILAKGETKGSVVVDRRDGGQVQVDCRVVPRESYGAALQYFTGNKDHNVRLRELAIKRKWKLNEWGLFNGERQLAGKEEEDIYAKLAVLCLPPELREDRGELAWKEVPRLICLEDIRGDCHTHTKASDGTAEAAEMAQAAAARGYEYIAVTDHSKSSAIANGLSIDRMWRQIEKLRTLNKKLPDLTILVGCECDILANGKLDYPDALLAACDFVVASVHSSLRQDEAKATARVLAAIENPNVTLLGHPTGRLINRREPMKLDMRQIVERAAKTGTALELNASWQRLDLCDVHLRMARDSGVRICIDTDAHSTAQFEQMRFGILTARRAGLTPADVINTMPLPALRKWIAKKRKG